MMDTILCAEYLALTIARRRGWGPGDAHTLAILTGLPVPRCAQLARCRDLTEVATRRHALDRVTVGVAA